MANEDQLNILRQGAAAWNRWREENPDIEVDLSEAYLCGANLAEADLSGANLKDANLEEADLSGAILIEATLYRADLWDANLNDAVLSGANLIRTLLVQADLVGADLKGANLAEADLYDTNLNEADLTAANLTHARLDRVTLVRTKLTGCKIYGISAWGLKLDDETEQSDLVITPDEQPTITVDDIEVAQFIYLLLHSDKMRRVIDTIAKKAVLILGRFTPERKAILDTLRIELRNRGYLPILFEFEKPTERDLTETIKILAGMSLFVIADISNPKSSPLELQATVPDYMIPFVPIIQEGEEPFSMFKDLHIQYKRWVLAPLEYDSCDGLISVLDKAVIDPALQVHDKLLREKAAPLPLRHVKDYS